MRLEEVAWTSLGVASAGGRLEKVERLAALLRRLERSEIPVAVAYLSGELPQGRIGVGPATLREALAAEAAAKPSLTLWQVDEALGEIAGARGPGSATEKGRRLRQLFGRATEEERRFLARLLLGELRQGAQEGVMLEAVARAAGVPPGEVRRAVMLAGDAGEVACRVLSRGRDALADFSLRLFRPVKPMLAGTAEGVGEALGRAGRAAVEWKLDGARLQLHRDGDEVRVYTRRLNDETEGLPEVVAAARRLPVREVVLDGEALALHPDGRPRRFQETMRRFGRTKGVEAARRAVPLSPFFFDCLYLDGEPLLDLPAAERLRALDGAVPAALAVPRILTGDPAEAETFLRDALRRGHEGIMVKALDAPYAAGRRGAAWLKVKPAWTLDLVVLAAEWGHGRRRGRLSNLHLGARDAAGGGFAMVGKTFKGLTDAMLKWQTARLLELERERRGKAVLVRPELVVEVAFDGVQRSSRYPAGLALRFARVKGYREDKGPLEADTLEALRRIYEGRAPLPGTGEAAGRVPGA